MSASTREVVLRPMNAAERAEWLAALTSGYVRDRIEAGEPEPAAVAAVAEQLATYLPGGEPAPGHEMFVVEAEGRRVGIAWIGPHPQRPHDEGSGWLYDIELDAAVRGQGYGRAALAAVERRAAAAGRRNFGLNVFGSNAAARSLYASAGYREAAIVMVKDLDTGDAGEGGTSG